jgi:hypothetical protein
LVSRAGCVTGYIEKKSSVEQRMRKTWRLDAAAGHAHAAGLARLLAELSIVLLAVALVAVLLIWSVKAHCGSVGENADTARTCRVARVIDAVLSNVDELFAHEAGAGLGAVQLVSAAKVAKAASRGIR